MPGFQIPGLPPVPTIADVARLLQLQVQLLSELPETSADAEEDTVCGSGPGVVE